jgi:hypothetical protein
MVARNNVSMGTCVPIGTCASIVCFYLTEYLYFTIEEEEK